jgi:hypothetical protein
VSGFGLIALALITECRALVSCDCARCDGPISVGALVVPVGAGVMHRSCFYLRSTDVEAFKDARRMAAMRQARLLAAPVDANQGELFPRGSR